MLQLDLSLVLDRSHFMPLFPGALLAVPVLDVSGFELFRVHIQA